ncbi:MAG TPA: transcriptional regulator [Bacteroidales bacterium]|nr:transcriptional regulator [Bacteroidales bacterium]
MKDLLQHINKQFENRIRLGIMSILMVNDRIDFNSLKEYLQVTDGNLSSHLAALEKAAYIEVRKSFIGKKPNTSYAATENGRAAFQAHLNALEEFIKKQNS